MTGKHFAQIPVEVLTSDAFRSLPSYAVKPFVAIAAQYRGNNNGDLALTWATALEYGITSKRHLVMALPEMLNRGLIQKTRQGGKRPLGPTLYAVTWQPIDDLSGKIQCGATTAPANTWASWKDTSGKKRPRGINIKRTVVGPEKTDRQDRSRTITGPLSDQISAISGPSPDQKPQLNGTMPGPPSRSTREGQVIPVPGPSSSASSSVTQSSRTQASRGTRNSDTVVSLDPGSRRQKIIELLDAGLSPLQIQKAMHSCPPPLEDLERIELEWAAQRGYHSAGRPS